MLLTEFNFVLKPYESPLKCNFSVGLVNVHVKHPPEGLCPDPSGVSGGQ